MERLQKIIAQSGICSRRKAEELITLGKVEVNGKIITELGSKFTGKEEIKVNGQIITKEEFKYYCLYKPKNIISSVNDDKGRMTVIDILPKELKSYRLFPVGRLDYDVKGVLLLTNNGEFMNTCVGPKSNLEKEYLARVNGIVSKEDIDKLTKGITLDNVITRKCFAEVKEIDRINNSSLVTLVIKEGKYHQVKRMFEMIGHEVKHLKRVRFGVITLEGLKEGEVRELSIHEVKKLVVLSKGFKN